MSASVGARVVWATIFLDLPGDRFSDGVAFWQAVTATHLSTPRGPDGEFATLLPPDGDAFLRVQRFDDGPRVHLDLHVDDVPAAAADAVGLGATELYREEHVVLASPGGFVFCVVPDGGERRRPAPVDGPRGGRARVDQLCLDIPAPLVERERAFWTGLTGWAVAGDTARELVPLARPDGMPVRLLLQRLGDDDDRTHVTGHVDVAAAGPDRDVVVAEHVDLGARVVERFARWTVMRDPAGVVYCLTGRSPDTGLAPGGLVDPPDIAARRPRRRV